MRSRTLKILIASSSMQIGEFVVLSSPIGTYVSLVITSFNKLKSNLAQWKRAGLITRRSHDRNVQLLNACFFSPRFFLVPSFFIFLNALNYTLSELAVPFSFSFFFFFLSFLFFFIF